MNKKIILVAISVMLATLLGACGMLPAASGNVVPQISVSGNGQVYIVPDLAYVNIGVHSESPEVTAALEDNNKQSQAIRATLMEMGIEEKDIQTTAFNIFPMQEFNPMGEVTGNKYVVENTVMVTVRDLANLGSLLEGVVNSGANTINSISFDAQNKEAAYTEARKLAVESARRQAAELAEAAGAELGDLITVSAYNSNPTPLYDVKAYSGQGGNGQVPVAAGQIVINVDATVTYAIK